MRRIYIFHNIFTYLGFLESRRCRASDGDYFTFFRHFDRSVCINCKNLLRTAAIFNIVNADIVATILRETHGIIYQNSNSDLLHSYTSQQWSDKKLRYNRQIKNMQIWCNHFIFSCRFNRYKCSVQTLSTQNIFSNCCMNPT